METSIRIKREKKKNRKPILMLSGFLLLFAVFIYYLTRPSLQNKAIDRIQACDNLSDVKSLFDHYKFDLLESNEDGTKIISADFQDAVRNKLNSFKLNEDEINKCLEWLPPPQTDINIIVIPDLSRRIIDTINNPHQILNDSFVLNTIWHSFVDYSKLKQDTEDEMVVDVTDIDQAKGQFEAVANELHFELSKHKGKSNRLYFTQDKTSRFESAVKTLYASAKQKPLGADYVFYFRRYLENHLKKPTLFRNYANKVIIITDGYLEPEKGPADTKLVPQLYRAVAIGNIKETLTMLGLSIPKVPLSLSNTDVMVCEVNERSTGRNKDYEILKAYWEDWLGRMNAHKIEFIQRNQSSDVTKEKLERFINN